MERFDFSEEPDNESMPVSDAKDTAPVTREGLVEMVMASLKRKRVPQEMVEQAVAALDLSNVQPSITAAVIFAVR